MLGPLVAGVALFTAFILYQARARRPMLPLELFRRRNFAFGNVETFAMYGGLGATFFFLVLYLQQVAGYDALQAGLATLPTTIVMFALSKRAGRLAGRYGPRAFMGFGPLVAAAGLALMTRLGSSPGYFTDVLPPILVFSLGLTATVAPLTTTVLADADEQTAGIASGVNNAIARVASLLAVAAIGAVASASFDSAISSRVGQHHLSAASQAAVQRAERRTIATVDASRLPRPERQLVSEAVTASSMHAFHDAIGISAVLVGLGGLLGLIGIRNGPPRVRAQ